MGCTSCSNSNGSKPAGCRSNGYCVNSGCNKLPAFDWLANMVQDDQGVFPYVEVRFKNGRKSFFRVPSFINPSMGSLAVVQVNQGYDIGVICLKGELTRTQMRLKKVSSDDVNIEAILRLPSQEEIEFWHKLQAREGELQRRSRQMALKLNLEMKISDVEFQADGRKAIFYYTADQRVDFRELIRVMASEFKVKIEMCQIGMRSEASRIGGIGICGRELCCSTWLTDFRKVSSSAARYQQLSFSPDRLNGQCGKLKCCLNYELESYTEELKKFPSIDIKLKTDKGYAIFQKMNIFSNEMWYSYESDRVNWFKLDVSSVKEIIKNNQLEKSVSKLEDFVVKEDNEMVEEFVYEPIQFSKKKPRTRKKQSKA